MRNRIFNEVTTTILSDAATTVVRLPFLQRLLRDRVVDRLKGLKNGALAFSGNGSGGEIVCGAADGALGSARIEVRDGRFWSAVALGGALGAIAVAAKHEIVLGIIGGLFVLETMSVIIQVASFKMTGKRVFAMAPLHHHFEQKGWKEPTIVIRFWIISLILAMIGLATLKVR